MKHLKLTIMSILIASLAVIGLTRYWLSPLPLEISAFNSLYMEPNIKPEGSLRVFHLGHSLVGRDMPSMIRQLAGSSHTYESQLGWGTRLNAHWEEDIEIKGYKEDNNHPNFRQAHEAIQSGDYDALILTEGVELKDSIKYNDSYLYLNKWANAAYINNPDIKVYLYETWHNLDDPAGWLSRLDNDLPHLWEKQVLRRALALENKPKPIYIIPGGQVMASFVRYIEEHGGVGNIKTRQDLFGDTIHFNDFGAYLMALTHYAVIYRKSPVGLPHKLIKADGTPAKDPGPEVAALMQQIVWDVVTSYDKTGVYKTML